MGQFLSLDEESAGEQQKIEMPVDQELFRTR